MSLSSRSQGTHRKLDPRKDKLAYFAGNIQTHDEEDFDPKIYYYQRQEKEGVGQGQPQLGGLGGMMSSNGSVLGEHASTPSRYAFAQQQAYMGHNGLGGSSRGAPPGMNLQNLQSASASGGMQSREQLLGRYAGASASQQMGMQQHGLHSMNSLGAMGGSMTVGGGRSNGTMQGAASVRSTTPTSSGAMRQVNPAAMMQNIGAPSSAGYNPSGDLLAMINSRSGGGSTGGMGILSASGGFINNTLPSSNNSSSSSNDAKEAISLHDMTQFPILGLNTSSSDSATLSLLSSASSSSSSAAAMAAKAAAAAAQPSSQKGTKEFAIQHEEFPALTSPQTLQHQHHQQQQQQQQQRYKSSGFPGGGNNGASNDLVSPQSPSGGEEVSGSLLHDDGSTDHNIYQQQQNASYPASASLRKSGGALSNHVGVMPHSNASHYHHLMQAETGQALFPEALISVLVLLMTRPPYSSSNNGKCTNNR
ncbi:RING-type domain-containing protein [Balamuthia mandrillaris]